MNWKVILPALFLVVILAACNKSEGPGGTSTIRGTVMGREFEPAKAEVTEVIVSPGSELEHGDFWVINAPVGHTYYYVWYNNPTWISDGDPHLAGRTGIEVSFNYSDSNLEIAQHTADALNALASADLAVNSENDVLLLTHKKVGAVPDANNMSTPFEINIANQGEDEVKGALQPLADARVYLVYGAASGYGDEMRTGGDGDFAFTNLVKGDYTLYVVCQDTLNPAASFKNETAVTISKNKSVVVAQSLELIY